MNCVALHLWRIQLRHRPLPCSWCPSRDHLLLAQNRERLDSASGFLVRIQKLSDLAWAFGSSSIQKMQFGVSSNLWSFLKAAAGDLLP